MPLTLARDLDQASTRLRTCVRGHQWDGAIDAARQLRERLDGIARQGGLPAHARDAAIRAVAALRELQPHVEAEMQRLPQEIARLQHYRAAAGAYAHHDLPLERLD